MIRPCRRVFELTALAFAVAFAVLQSSSFGVESTGRPRETRLSEPVSVPMNLDLGKLTVEVMVNGRGPYKFLLDTGAGVTVLNQDFADELGLAPIGETRIGDPSNPEAIAAKKVVLDSVALGGVEFVGVGAVSFERGSLYKGESPPRGVLGLPLFSDCLLTLNYPEKVVQLANKGLPAADDDKTVLPFEYGEGGLPRFDITVGGSTFPTHLDSGAMGGVSVPPAFAEKLRFTGEPVVVGRGRTVNSEFEIRSATLAGSVMIGTLVLESPRIGIHPVLKTVNIGTGILKDCLVSVDQRNRRIRIVHAAALNSGAARAAAPMHAAGAYPSVVVRNPQDRPRVGVILAFTEAHARIVDIIPGSLAETSGLEHEDYIVAVNGKPFADLGEPGLREMFATAPQLVLDLDRDGKKVQVQIDLSSAGKN